MVFDDYHLIENQSIHESLQYFIEHLPPNIVMTLSTRIDPPFPLARWRVRNQLFEVRAQDLRFTHEEIIAFLQDVMGLTLEREAIEALEARTEGWIASLQLVALSIQRRPDVQTFIADFTGSNRYILSYLMDEVFAQQSEVVQQFLLSTSVLPLLTPALCDVVTQDTRSSQLLDELYRNNLFLVALDESGQQYRYHHLFADMLQHRARQTMGAALPTLHRRAAQWFAEQQQITQAIDHYLLAEAHTEAAQLIVQHYKAVLATGNGTLVSQWLAKLPSHLLQTDPHLAIAYAWAKVLTSQVTEIGDYLETVERTLANATPPNTQQFSSPLMRPPTNNWLSR